MGMFGGIDKVDSTHRSAYLVPGVFELEVTAIKQGKARDGRGYFVAEFEVITSSTPERQPGSVVSWMVMLDPGYLATALGNIKGFLSPLTGVPEKEIDEAGVEDATSAANPCKGMRIKASASMVKTRKGKDFTQVAWSPVAAQAA